MGRLWPLAPFVGWAILSVAWSDEAGTTFHAVAALVAVLVAGYLIAFRLPGAQLAQAVLVAAALIAATSVGYALFLPLHGVHQVGDADQQVHAGAWRGIYQHKNFLGQMAAILATAAILSDRRVVASGPVKWALVAVLVFLVVMSTSATAFTILPVALVLTWGTVMASRKTRLRVSVLALPAIVLLYEGTGMILHSLHRDATFTGRDKVWAIAWDSIQDRIVQGYGYNSLTFGDFLYQLMREVGMLDPHSAYLDTVLGLGAIGLVLFALAVAVPWATARRLAAAGGGERAAGVVLGAVTIGWLIGGITEASDRPLTPMGGLGLFALAALLGAGSRVSRGYGPDGRRGS